ncbi:MAG: hypothetical protein K0U45_02990, partial [Alphaproteobacteria bacterium]|nr:hypothetical protein [Alphaproteobacteria bacterium]
MKQFFLSIVTLLMFSVFLSGCIIAEEEPIEEQDEFGIYHVPTNDAPETKFGDNSLRDEFTTIMSSVNNETASFDLPALAVQHNNAGNTKTVSNFIAPVFSVSYYRDNNFIGISEAMVHVGEKKYGVFNLTSDGTETYVARNNEVKGAGSNASAKLTINNSPFGFAFNNMLSVEWELHKIVAEGVPNSSEYGYMIAGLETDGADIPITSEAVTFEGKGKGKYDSSNDVDFTAFDVTADINFATRNIALATEDTKNADDEALAYLDFTSTLNYRAGTNNISGTVSTNGMSGFIDARFYSSTGVPLELGGTFAMRNDESVSYIGMFGAANTDTNTITVNDPTPKPTPIEPEVPQILNPKPTEPEPTPKPTPIAPEAPPTLNPKPTEPEPTPKPIPTPPNTTIDNIDIIQVQTNDAPDAITDIGSLFFNASVSLQENTAYDVTLSALAVQQNDSGTAKTVSN